MAEVLLILDSPLFPYLFSLGLTMVAVVWMSARHSRRMRHFAKQQDEQMHSLKSELHVLLNSAEGMGEKLGLLEERVRLLEQRQDQITLKEPSEQVYSHALRMVRGGEDISTVMERSGISRGEAELLQLLNGMHQEGGKDKSAA